MKLCLLSSCSASYTEFGLLTSLHRSISSVSEFQNIWDVLMVLKGFTPRLSEGLNEDDGEEEFRTSAVIHLNHCSTSALENDRIQQKPSS